MACRNTARGFSYARAAQSAQLDAMLERARALRPVVIEKREVDLLGRPALLQVERITATRVRALVAVQLGADRGSFGSPWTYPPEVQADARRIAREAVETHARATSEGTFASGWICDGEVAQ